MRVLPTGTPGAMAVTLTPHKMGLLELVVKRDGPWMNPQGAGSAHRGGAGTYHQGGGRGGAGQLAQSAMVSADNQPSRG